MLKAQGSKNGRFSTSTEKYSSNLYEKPMGSLAFIKPETIKSEPTKILEIEAKVLNMFGSIKIVLESNSSCDIKKMLNNLYMQSVY